MAGQRLGRDSLVAGTRIEKIMWDSGRVPVCDSVRPRAFMRGAAQWERPEGTGAERSPRDNEKPIRVLTALREDERMPRNRP